jgi:hypothetical protein
MKTVRTYHLLGNKLINNRLNPTKTMKNGKIFFTRTIKGSQTWYMGLYNQARQKFPKHLSIVLFERNQIAMSNQLLTHLSIRNQFVKAIWSVLFFLQDVAKISEIDREITFRLVFNVYWTDCRVKKTTNKSKAFLEPRNEIIPIFKPSLFHLSFQKYSKWTFAKFLDELLI